MGRSSSKKKQRNRKKEEERGGISDALKLDDEIRVLSSEFEDGRDDESLSKIDAIYAGLQPTKDGTVSSKEKEKMEIVENLYQTGKGLMKEGLNGGVDEAAGMEYEQMMIRAASEKMKFSLNPRVAAARVLQEQMAETGLRGAAAVRVLQDHGDAANLVQIATKSAAASKLTTDVLKINKNPRSGMINKGFQGTNREDEDVMEGRGGFADLEQVMQLTERSVSEAKEATEVIDMNMNPKVLQENMADKGLVCKQSKKDAQAMIYGSSKPLYEEDNKGMKLNVLEADMQAAYESYKRLEIMMKLGQFGEVRKEKNVGGLAMSEKTMAAGKQINNMEKEQQGGMKYRGDKSVSVQGNNEVDAMKDAYGVHGNKRGLMRAETEVTDWVMQADPEELFANMEKAHEGFTELEH